jgi:arginyl-tRNA synthetase
MQGVFDLVEGLNAALREAAGRAGLDAAAWVPGVRTADPRHGDFQANGILALAKRSGVNPRALAEQVASALAPEVRAQFEVSVAGPGFINFSVGPAALMEWLAAYGTRADLAAGAAAAQAGPLSRAGQTWVVDYSSPNTAKQMHVGHLRSAVIGEAIARLLAFAGARVIRDNHIGDWGTQFGKLIWACRRELDEAAMAREPLEEFERLYKVGHAAAEADPAVMEQARAELVRLQAGDADNLEWWRRINAASLGAFQSIYARLGIRFDVMLGESFYNDQVGRVYAELAGAGLAVESEGALVVFHPEHPRFKSQPLMVRKSDGAANYASTDLATILYRTEHFHATGAVYVVDKRQSDHFEQLFLTAGKWFQRAGRAVPQLVHVDFGTVLGENGKPLKTRDGNNLKLKDLLDEAAERAFVLVGQKSPDLPEAERRAIAEVVGVGSVQYADLAQNRSSDYLFSWDKMISLEGNTAAYLLYAVARIHSIFRRLGEAAPVAVDSSRAGAEAKVEAAAGAEAAAISGGEAGPAVGAVAGTLSTPGEMALARKLVKFPDALRLATESLRPHFLCLYLYELAGEFSAFYAADKVIVDEVAVRARRLLLCARTLLVLETGLELLGLRTLQRM